MALKDRLPLRWLTSSKLSSSDAERFLKPMAGTTPREGVYFVARKVALGSDQPETEPVASCYKEAANWLPQKGAHTVDCLVGDILVGTAPRPHDPLVPTVFHSDWWLNIVSGGGWEEASVSASGKIVGRFPYVIGRMLGGHALCGMPPITHFLGPAIDEGKGSACNRALKRSQITRDLLEVMPKTSGFYQKLSREVTDTLLFQEEGFTTSVQFTFEIVPAPQPLLWRTMRDKTRNVIRRAQESGTVEVCPDPGEFTAAYERHLGQRSFRNYYNTEMLNRLCAAAISRDQGKILIVRDGNGDIAAGIFCVSDATSMYYLLTTRDRNAGNGVVALLLWQAIQESSARGLIFDFDGVGVNGSRLFFTGFGGQVRPRYIVSRYTAAHRIMGRVTNPFRRHAQTTYY
jgi:hypothetical protein